MNHCSSRSIAVVFVFWIDVDHFPIVLASKSYSVDIGRETKVTCIIGRTDVRVPVVEAQVCARRYEFTLTDEERREILDLQSMCIVDVRRYFVPETVAIAYENNGQQTSCSIRLLARGKCFSEWLKNGQRIAENGYEILPSRAKDGLGMLLTLFELGSRDGMTNTSIA